MKPLFIAVAFLLLSISHVFSQAQYEVLPDYTGNKILKGIISRDILEKDSSFTWYAYNKKSYAPNAEAIAGLRKNADSLQLVVFMGTWCDDSHYIIPKLFSLVDAAGFSNSKISLFGVDRNKKTLGHLAEAL